MSIKIITGNIFTTKCQTLVNTVNCVGVMGAGIALECRLRYPEMFKIYQSYCAENRIQIGKLWIYRKTNDKRWILNFPTKKHWKYPSQKEYLQEGLVKFIQTYEKQNITSIAFPLLGADKGGIPKEESLNVMTHYLQNLSIPIEIYKYDSKAPDDLFEKTKSWINSHDIGCISSLTKLRKDYVAKVIEAINSPDICQLNQIVKFDGIGIVTLEKIFNASRAQIEIEIEETNQILRTFKQY